MKYLLTVLLLIETVWAIHVENNINVEDQPGSDVLVHYENFNSLNKLLSDDKGILKNNGRSGEATPQEVNNGLPPIDSVSANQKVVLGTPAIQNEFSNPAIDINEELQPVQYLIPQHTEGSMLKKLEDSPVSNQNLTSQNSSIPNQNITSQNSSIPDQNVTSENSSNPNQDITSEAIHSSSSIPTTSITSYIQTIDIGRTLKAIAKNRIFRKILSKVAKSNVLAEVFQDYLELFVDEDSNKQLEEIKTEILNAIDRQTDILMRELEKLSLQITDVSEQVIASTAKNTFERDYQQLNTVFIEIDKEVDNFVHILESYHSNKEKLKLEIETLVNRLKANSYDYKLIRITSPSTRRSFDKSIIETYLEYLKHYNVETRSTANQQIQWFYNHVLEYVLKFDVLMMACFGSLKKITDGNYTEDIQFVESKTTENTEIITKEMIKMFDKFSDVQHRMNFLTKIKTPEEDKNFAVLSRSIYIYFMNQELMSKEIIGYNQCCLNCQEPHYSDLRVSRDYKNCDGRIYDCVENGNVYMKYGNYSREVYRGYCHHNICYGKYTGGEEKKVIGTNPDDTKCPCKVCRCKCDNMYGGNSVRFFYNKVFKREPGYVIIGTKLVKKHRSIFLQPQVAKLTPLGTINMNTSKWLEIPFVSSPRKEDLVEISYVSRRFIRCGTFELDNGAFVTGVRFKNGFDNATKSYHVDLEVTGKNFLFLNGTVYESLIEQKASNVQNPVLVEFQLSEHHFAGQYPIPSFDTQEVSLDNPLPLTGIRLENYTSVNQQFLVPKVITIDLKKSLDTGKKKPVEEK